MALRKKPAESLDFETSLQKLEAIVKRLEEEEIPLEESLKLFAEGQQLARACEQRLVAAENQVRQILENAGGQPLETPFEPPLGDEGGSEIDAESEFDSDTQLRKRVEANRPAPEPITPEAAREEPEFGAPPPWRTAGEQRRPSDQPPPPGTTEDDLPF